MQALALANIVRTENAKTKRTIAGLSYLDGCTHVADLLDRHPDGPFRSMKALELLCAIHRVQEGSATPLLHGVGVYRPDRRVGELTDRQRAELALTLRVRVSSYRPRRMAA